MNIAHQIRPLCKPCLVAASWLSLVANVSQKCRFSIIIECKGTKGCPLENRKTGNVTHEQLAMRFFMSHRPMLTDYAAKVVGDRAQAEDIVQEAWLSLARQRGNADVRDPISYLRTMVRNLAIDALRRKMRESRLSGGDMETAIHMVADGRASPEAALSARRDLACVLGVLRTLPERQRTAIEMYRFGGHKLREIAAHLNISVPLVHLLISEGLATCADRCGIDTTDL